MIKNFKLVMNPMRLNVLKRLFDLKETNVNGLGTGYCVSYSREAVQRAYDRFVELGYICHTGGGYFTISENGEDCLREYKII